MLRLQLLIYLLVFTVRRLHHPLRDHADRGGDAAALAGARSGAEAESWSCRSLETGETQQELQSELQLKLQLPQKF